MSLTEYRFEYRDTLFYFKNCFNFGFHPTKLTGGPSEVLFWQVAFNYPIALTSM